MDARRTALVSFLERTKLLDGVRVDATAILRLRARQQAAGRRIVEGQLRYALDPSTFATVQRAISTDCYADGLELCLPVAGFGSILGEAVLGTLGKSGMENECTLDWAALWNLLVAYFDELCDEYDSLLPILLTRISPDSLRGALHPDSNLRLAPEPSDPVLLRFVVQIAEAVFSRLRSLKYRVPGTDFHRIGQAIQMAYGSEIKTAQLRFSALPLPQEVHKHLRAASSLPVWILGCVAALGSGIAPLPRQLESSLEHIGDVLWLLDDLADFESDVGTDRWNAIFLVAADRHGASLLQELTMLAPQDRIVWLHENGMPEILANRIFELLRLALTGLDNTFGKGSPLAKELVSILWSFANEMPDHS